MSEGLYAWEHPLPEGFVPVPDPRENDPATAACMGLTVANKWDRATAGAEPFVEVTDASGRRVYLARGRHYDFEPGAPRLRMSLVVDYCGDLNADGVPELVLTERTMGAHCCYTHYVVSMTRPAKRLLVWEKGDAGGGMVPIKAKAGSHYQLLSNVVLFPPFGEDHAIGVSYSGAPMLPIIFQLEGAEYRPRTFRFSSFLDAARDKSRRGCVEHPDCEPNELVHWGVALIVGDWERRRSAIETEPHIMAAMNATSTSFREMLIRELGR